MRQELRQALELALQAGRATQDERTTILGALRDANGKPNERYIATKQAAALLDCCAKSLFRFEQRGLIRAVRRSKRSLRWRESEILRLRDTGAGVAP